VSDVGKHRTLARNDVAAEPAARTAEGTIMRYVNPYTEASASLRRHKPRPPFPGQRTRRPFSAVRHVEASAATNAKHAAAKGSTEARRRTELPRCARFTPDTTGKNDR
jgi:hypothetical protein